MGHFRSEPVAWGALRGPPARFGALAARSPRRRTRSDLQCSGPLSIYRWCATTLASGSREILAKWLRLSLAKTIGLQSSNKPNATVTDVAAVSNKHKALRTRLRFCSNFKPGCSSCVNLEIFVYTTLAVLRDW